MWNPTNDLPEPMTTSSRALRLFSVLSAVAGAICLVAIPVLGMAALAPLLVGAFSGVVSAFLLRAVAIASDCAVIAARATRDHESALGELRRQVRKLSEDQRAA